MLCESEGLYRCNPQWYLCKMYFCKQDVSDEDFETVLLNFLEHQYKD